RESLDPVRFLANKSSGKMGYAIAQVLQKRGAEVVLISGPTNLTPPAGVQSVSITSAQQMLTAAVQEFQSSAALIMAAAVADFRPEHLAQQKIKKTSTDSTWNLKLVKTADILQAVAQIKHPSQTTIGFAAETQNLMTNALQKLENKKLDLVVANDVSKTNVGFNSDNNQVTFIKQGQKPWTTAILPKVQIAEQIADQLEILMQQKSILK
ncbi:MAG: phosphopantothenoylcysteine decarboxylase, partial [Bombilactobacillus sp.]